MEFTYITAVQNLKLAENLGRGDRLDEHTFITNDQKQIRSLVHPAYVPIIGTLEWEHLLNAGAVIYSTETAPKEIAPLDFLDEKLMRTSVFFHTLWLHTDNSVNNELAFLFYKENGVQAATSNFLAVSLTQANGETTATNLSRAKLQEVRRSYRELFAKQPFLRKAATKLQSEANRLERAFYQAQAARAAPDVAIKIVHYSSALETLFATSQSELSHQLAERIACFLDNTIEHRIDTYRAVKAIYNFRSRITHGGPVGPNKLEDLVTYSTKADQILRRCFQRVFEKDELYEILSDNQKLDDYFLRLILGTPKDLNDNTKTNSEPEL